MVRAAQLHRESMTTIEWRVRPRFCRLNTAKADSKWSDFFHLASGDEKAHEYVRVFNRLALLAAKHPKQNGGAYVFEYRVKP